MPLQVEPILPSGEVSFGEQLAAELEEEDGPPGASAAANAIKALRAWNRERADGVAATQEVLMTRIDRAELLSDDVMRRASRAGAVGRMLAADLKHGALHATAPRPARPRLLRSRLPCRPPLASRARCGGNPALTRRTLALPARRCRAQRGRCSRSSPRWVRSYARCWRGAPRRSLLPAAHGLHARFAPRCSYAQLLKTFEAAAARRPAGSSPLRPATLPAQPALPMSPLRLAAVPPPAQVPGGFSLEPAAPSSARASWSYVGRGDGHNSPQLLRREPRVSGSSVRSAASSPRGSPRIGRPDVPDSPESLGREPRSSPPRISLDSSRGSSGGSGGSGRIAPGLLPQQLQQQPAAAAQQAMLPPLRMPLPPVRTSLQPEAKPLSPAAKLQAGGGGSATAAVASGAGGATMPPTPQSKRALFGAVAEAAAAAAAAGGAVPISATIAVSQTGSPRAVLRPEAPSARPFALEAVGSPRHVRLGPVGTSSPGGGGADRSGSPSMLRLDPWRGSGVDAFSLGPPALASESALPVSATAAGSAPGALPVLQPLQPPRSPLRGMGRRGEGATPRALSGLGPSAAYTPRSGGSLFSDAPPDADADPQGYRMAAPAPGPAAPPARRSS